MIAVGVDEFTLVIEEVPLSLDDVEHVVNEDHANDQLEEVLQVRQLLDDESLDGAAAHDVIFPAHAEELEQQQMARRRYIVLRLRWEGPRVYDPAATALQLRRSATSAYFPRGSTQRGRLSKDKRRRKVSVCTGWRSSG